MGDSAGAGTAAAAAAALQIMRRSRLTWTKRRQVLTRRGAPRARTRGLHALRSFALARYAACFQRVVVVRQPIPAQQIRRRRRRCSGGASGSSSDASPGMQRVGDMWRSGISASSNLSTPPSPRGRALAESEGAVRIGGRWLSRLPLSLITEHACGDSLDACERSCRKS